MKRMIAFLSGGLLVASLTVGAWAAEDGHRHDPKHPTTSPTTHPKDGDHKDGKHKDGKHKDGKHKDGKHKDGKHKDGKHKDGNKGDHAGNADHQDGDSHKK